MFKRLRNLMCVKDFCAATLEGIGRKLETNSELQLLNFNCSKWKLIARKNMNDVN